MTLEIQNIQPHLHSILESVSDPEIPVLSIMDMGVVREAIEVDGVVQVKITPTYSGCPAMDVIGDDIVSAFAKANKKAKITLVLSPAWTTDWITPRGRKPSKIMASQLLYHPKPTKKHYSEIRKL